MQPRCGVVLMFDLVVAEILQQARQRLQRRNVPHVLNLCLIVRFDKGLDGLDRREHGARAKQRRGSPQQPAGQVPHADEAALVPRGQPAFEKAAMPELRPQVLTGETADLGNAADGQNSGIDLDGSALAGMVRAQLCDQIVIEREVIKGGDVVHTLQYTVYVILRQVLDMSAGERRRAVRDAVTTQILDDPTIDPAEVAHYTSLAHTWWDPAGPFWPLHKLNELRAAFIREHLCAHFGRDPGIGRPLEGITVLDVGCGGGILSESLASMGATVRGIDVVEKNIRIARLHAAENGLDIDYRLQTIAEEVAAENRYDVVLNMEVVEHVADVPAFMRDCGAAANDSGVMFVATINRTLKSWLFAIVGAEYVLRLLPRGTHRWQDFQHPDRMASLLDEAGLRVAEQTGVAMNPLARKLYFVRSMAVNYMLFATRG